MNTLKHTIIGALILLIVSCSNKPTIDELKKFAAIETYPVDNYLDTVSNKKALVIVAHDDDDCAMSGTIAKLSQNGWTIKQLSFNEHLILGQDKNPAHIICQGNEPILLDGLYRIGLDTIKTQYLPIPYEEIDKQFLTEKVAKAITIKVNEFNPTVIFTLDNIKGAYGHPDHIFLSQLVVDLFNSNSIACQRIYQSVYTDHMEKEIIDIWLKAKMKKWGYPHVSTIANELYRIDGMPEPTVQIDITEQAEAKMNYLRAYPESVRKNLRKFIPYYEEFEAREYFSVFDREFFRVIEK